MNKNSIKKGIIAIFLIVFLIFSRKNIQIAYNYAVELVAKFNFKLVEYRSNIYNVAVNFKDKIVLVSDVDKFIDSRNKMQEEIEQKNLALNDLEDIKKENQLLRDTLNLKSKLSYESMAVEVKLSESLDEDLLYITKGYDDGIKLNQVVIYSGNMIGKISRVEKDYSEVMLITNKKSKISVIMNNSYLTVIRGNANGTFSIKNYNTDIDIDKNNYFELKTSGVSDIIFKDINIGSFRVKDKETFKKTKELIFEPTYKYADIRIVLVLKEVK